MKPSRLPCRHNRIERAQGAKLFFKVTMNLDAAHQARRFYFFAAMRIMLAYQAMEMLEATPTQTVISDSPWDEIQMPAPRPSFFVREIPIYGDVVLAPMDGFS